MEVAKRQLETQIKRDVRGASEKLLGYVDDITKEVKSLTLSLEGWDASAAVEEADLSLDFNEVAATPSPAVDEPRQPDIDVAPPVESPPQASPDATSPPVRPASPVVADVPPPAPPTAPPPAPASPVTSAPADAPATPTASAAPATATTPSAPAVQEGSVQLVVQAPVNLAALGEIYERLVQLEDVTLRDTRKSNDGSYVINLTLGGPTPLLDILSGLGSVAEASSQDGNGTTESGASGSSDSPATTINVKLT